MHSLRNKVVVGGGVYKQHGGAEVKKVRERDDRTNKRERRDCIIKWVWLAVSGKLRLL